jgi:hypothetical protein
MRTHSCECLRTSTLLAAMAVSGCGLRLRTPPPSAHQVFAAGDPSTDDSSNGDPAADDPVPTIPGVDGQAPVRTGIIIPAYLPLGQRVSWSNLSDQAAAMRDAGGGTKDFWVAVNGAGNGPYANATDWTTAESLFDPVRANGGAIFGYVHSCKTDSIRQHPSYYELLPMDAVKADIAKWIAGYPRIDGIWIDEFYPRYEIADSPLKGTDPILMFPNGRGAGMAPADQRSFLNADGSFNGVQVDPTGGYYETLTSWIRTTYPTLRIIGNAGGKLYSNQTAYANLVDVLCTFEQTYAEAGKNNWDRLTPLPGLTVPQLALFHSTSASNALFHSTSASEMDGALSRALALGYSHVYSTDLLYELPDGAPGNPWGDVSSYLADEVAAIAAQP